MLTCLGCLRELDVRPYIAADIKEKIQELGEGDILWLKDLKIKTSNFATPEIFHGSFTRYTWNLMVSYVSIQYQ